MITRPDETTLAVTSAGPAPYRHNRAKPESTSAKEADSHLNVNLSFIIPFAALVVCPTSKLTGHHRTLVRCVPVGFIVMLLLIF